MAARQKAREIQEVSAWRPALPGVVEVFHAHFTEYACPMPASGVSMPWRSAGGKGKCAS